MTASRLAWTIAVVDLVGFVATGSFDPTGDVAATVLYGIGIGSFAFVGALLRTRVPANPIGALLLGAGTLLAAAMTLVRLGGFGGEQVPEPAWAGVATLAGSTLFVYPFAIALIGVPLVFPDGRLPSTRFRWVVWITVVGMLAGSLGGILGAPLDGGLSPADPAYGGLDLARNVLQLVLIAAAVIGFGAGAVAVALRFRRGGPAQRQQVKWLVAVVGLGAVVLPLSFVPVDSSPELGMILSNIAVLTLFALPLVVGLAVLRYRLYAIDRIVSRTIGYAVITALLAGIFLATNLALQAWMAEATGSSTIGIAASTLLVAALFQPVRRAVQAPIDRRFNRARVDAARTVAAFATRTRDEIDLDRLARETRLAAAGAVQPTTAAVWLRDGHARP